MVEYRGFEIEEMREGTSYVNGKYYGSFKASYGYINTDSELRNTAWNEFEGTSGYFDTLDQVKEAIDKYYAKENTMIGKDFNWLIVNIDTQEKWNKVVDKIYSIDKNFLIGSTSTWYEYYDMHEGNTIGNDGSGKVSYGWRDTHTEKHKPKIIECDDFLSEENSESLEKTYQGKEIFKALLDGKKLTFGNDIIHMNADGTIKDEDDDGLNFDYVIGEEWTEYKEPKQHTHQELEDILGYKFKYVS